MISHRAFLDPTNAQLIFPVFKKRQSILFPESKDIKIQNIHSRVKYDHNITVLYTVLGLFPNGKKEKKIIIGKSAAVALTKPSSILSSHLWNHGFQKPPFLVNRPLGYEPRFNLTLVERLEGPIFSERFRQLSKKEIQKKSLQSILWLKKFHMLRPNHNLRPLPFQKLTRDVFFAIHQIPDHQFHYEKQLLENRLQGMKNDLGIVSRFRFRKNTHLDFGPHNIILLQKGIGVIDFDSSCRFDPLIDFASFLTQLYWGLPNINDFQQWKENEIFSLANRLTGEYRRGQSRTSLMHFSERFNLFQQLSLIKIATHVLVWTSETNPSKRKKFRQIIEKFSLMTAAHNSIHP